MQARFLTLECWLLCIVCLILVSNFSPVFAKASLNDATVCNNLICFIRITEGGFSPEKLVIHSGSTVIWKNMDNHLHLIELGTSKNQILVNATLLSKGESYAYTFQSINAEEAFNVIDPSESGISGKIVLNNEFPKNREEGVILDFTDPGSGIANIGLAQGKVLSTIATPRLHNIAVTISSDAGKNNILNLTLARWLLDSQANGKDVPFIVFVNGEHVKYEERQATTSQRSMLIPIEMDTKNVTILGSDMTITRTGYEKARELIDEAEKSIAKNRSTGIFSNDSEDLLLKSQDFFAMGKYHLSNSLSSQAIGLATKVIENARVSNLTIVDSERALRTAKGLGLEVAEPEEMIAHSKELYATGNYAMALSLALQTKMSIGDSINRLYLIFAISSSSIGILLVYVWKRYKHALTRPNRIENRSTGSEAVDGNNLSDYLSLAKDTSTDSTSNGSLSSRDSAVDLDQVFAEKPHLRSDDRKVLKYIVENKGEVLLAEIRNRFTLPKSTAWRLVKRLEREELVEIVKFGNQNLIKCRLKR